jgi:hypothetical protein
MGRPQWACAAGGFGRPQELACWIEFLDSEIAEVDCLIADQTLRSGDARHLLTVPGVNVVCPATFLAAIGDIRRFRTSRQLVAYLGLDPKVRQSGSEPARLGRISKQGSSQARWALVEATHSVILQPGPLRAFHQRVRARLARCAQPRSSSPNKPRRPTCGWSATGRPQHRRKWARARHRSAHQLGPRRASRAADSKLLTSALRYVSHPRPSTTYRPQSTPTTRRRSSARK